MRFDWKIAGSAAAVLVLGGGVGTAAALASHSSTPARPAKVEQTIAPAAQPIATVTVTASPTATHRAPAVKRVTSVHPTTQPRKQTRNAVTRQGVTVTDPTTTAADPQPQQTSDTPAYTPSIDPSQPGLPNPARPGGHEHPSPSN